MKTYHKLDSYLIEFFDDLIIEDFLNDIKRLYPTFENFKLTYVEAEESIEYGTDFGHGSSFELWGFLKNE